MGETRSPLRWYLYTLILLAAATVATIAVREQLGAAIAVFFFPVVVTVAIYGGVGPGLVASAVATIICAFFIVPPATTIDIGVDDYVRLLVLSGVSVTVSALSGAQRTAQARERQSQLIIAQQEKELAVREDRTRVSRDLHDGILQGLTGIRLELHDIADSVTTAADVHDRLLATERALATEQRELRRLIENLNPKAGTPAGADTLDEALRRRVARLAEEWKTPISIHVMPSELAVPAEIEQAIGFMSQEATINALKHGHPSRVSISVAASDSEIRLTVVDDGRGFPFSGRVDHDALMARNVGPVTLRERANSLKGRLAVESGSRGSRVDITLPRNST